MKKPRPKGSQTFYQENIEIKVDNLRDIVKEAVEEGHKKAFECFNCPIDGELGEELPHFMGMVKDIGEGQADKGVERMRANHIFTRKTRKMSGKISTAAIIAIVTALSGGLITCIWLGIKEILKG